MLCKMLVGNLKSATARLETYRVGRRNQVYDIAWLNFNFNEKNPSRENRVER